VVKLFCNGCSTPKDRFLFVPSQARLAGFRLCQKCQKHRRTKGNPANRRGAGFRRNPLHFNNSIYLPLHKELTRNQTEERKEMER
jgi:hypothetical protein